MSGGEQCHGPVSLDRILVRLPPCSAHTSPRSLANSVRWTRILPRALQLSQICGRSTSPERWPTTPRSWLSWPLRSSSILSCAKSRRPSCSVGLRYPASPNEDLAMFVDTVNYPLYIAAAYIGFTQPSILSSPMSGTSSGTFFMPGNGSPHPGLGHVDLTPPTRYSCGVPEADQLARELQVLISDRWVEQLDAYADAEFYRAHLARLKLESEGELLEGTRQELRPLPTAR